MPVYAISSPFLALPLRIPASRVHSSPFRYISGLYLTPLVYNRTTPISSPLYSSGTIRLSAPLYFAYSFPHATEPRPFPASLFLRISSLHPSASAKYSTSQCQDDATPDVASTHHHSTIPPLLKTCLRLANASPIESPQHRSVTTRLCDCRHVSLT